jgi:hypothetical protein
VTRPVGDVTHCKVAESPKPIDDEKKCIPFYELFFGSPPKRTRIRELSTNLIQRLMARNFLCS